MPTSRFASGFSDDVLAETTPRIAAWWTEAQQRRRRPTSRPTSGSTPSSGSRAPTRSLYRVAVAAALAFRLDRDRAGVIAAYTALDKAGVLADLYQGTVPENLPGAGRRARAHARVARGAPLRRGPRARVAARRPRARPPRRSPSLDAALGRGLFRTELFWIMDMLARLGVIRYDDLGDFTVTPHRIVRDTLFRLGFIASPYASDAAVARRRRRAARRAVPDRPGRRDPHAVRARRRLRLRLHAPQDLRLPVPRAPRVASVAEVGVPAGRERCVETVSEVEDLCYG